MNYSRRCDDLFLVGAVKTDPSRKVSVRKLSLRLLAAVHYACDIGELELAGKLLSLTEEAIACRHDVRIFSRRSIIDDVVSAYERLWKLRQDAPEIIPVTGAFESVRDILGGHTKI
ncbi:hypothetical protein [Acetobacter oeni]|uniref:Uncharacterized protein n=1 Tax=Acetobacter oeni TaxID=304077 RepID=A0A511XQ30_9PROT|nr:hypothetical protein [Acetobacter oeni]MBB3884719.1 hypothetical protein [Acetobacter oeni]NHO20649.1 hypothetical protein [Acetobacter oeni]GBR04759.1 hypothetical protein AA21952_1519 [Acetobacter oeni LMG 21952]GEN65047.1 hypothetical protein AOE01nite_32710 [Acetobacter oeni]